MAIEKKEKASRGKEKVSKKKEEKSDDVVGHDWKVENES